MFFWSTNPSNSKLSAQKMKIFCFLSRNVKVTDTKSNGRIIIDVSLLSAWHLSAVVSVCVRARLNDIAMSIHFARYYSRQNVGVVERMSARHWLDEICCPISIWDLQVCYSSGGIDNRVQVLVFLSQSYFVLSYRTPLVLYCVCFFF